MDQKLELDFELLTPSALFKQSIENNEIYDLVNYYVDLKKLLYERRAYYYWVNQSREWNASKDYEIRDYNTWI